MIKIILADDHKIVRNGLKALLEASGGAFQVVGEAASGNEVIAMLPDTEADVILMDIGMEDMNGLEATQYIREHFPSVQVLILSMMDQERYVAEAIKAGAQGYILKTTDEEELVHAIQLVARGEQYISTQIALKLLKNVSYQHKSKPNAVAADSFITIAEDSTNALSKRELEVLQLIAQGYTNIAIGDLLFTSKRTVETHRQNLLEKTGCKNTASLILYAAKHHLLDENKEAGAGR